jgi:PQQ-dependent catabolism-associated beta-propeller protein
MRRLLLALLLLAGCHEATSRTGTIYVSDEASNVVHVIDAATLSARGAIPVGHRPRGLALSPDRRLLYVALGDDNRIAIVDLAQGRVTGTLPCGPDPETIALSPDGRHLYAANENDNLLSIVDVAAHRITNQVPVGGEPEGTAVSPDGRLVIQASETASMAHVVDAAKGKVIDNLIVDTRPRYIAFTPDGRQFWVSSEIRATVTAFDTATRRRLGKIDFGELLPGERKQGENLQAVGIAFTRAGDRAFVALGRGQLVAEIDPKTLALVRTFPVGWRAWNLALSPDEHMLYTANGLSGDVTAIDLVHNRVVDSVPLKGKPWGIVVR